MPARPLTPQPRQDYHHHHQQQQQQQHSNVTNTSTISYNPTPTTIYDSSTPPPLTKTKTFHNTALPAGIRTIRTISAKGRPLYPAILTSLVVLSLMICPCLGLPLRRPPSSKNVTPSSVECREVLLCWVVQIQTHTLHCGDDGVASGGGSPEGLGEGCTSKRQQLVEEHAITLSRELGLEIHHTFGQFHDHLLLCVSPNIAHSTHQGIPDPSHSAGSGKIPRPTPTLVKGKATSSGISHLQKMHSDLKVKDKRLFDLWRQKVETSLAEHPEVLTFSSEHVHRRKSRLEIPPRMSVQEAKKSSNDSPSQSIKHADIPSFPPADPGSPNKQQLSDVPFSLKSHHGDIREPADSLNSVPAELLPGIGRAEITGALTLTKSSSDKRTLPAPVISIPKSFNSSLPFSRPGFTHKSSPSSIVSSSSSYVRSMSVSSTRDSSSVSSIDVVPSKKKQSTNRRLSKSLLGSEVNSTELNKSQALPNFPATLSSRRNRSTTTNPSHQREENNHQATSLLHQQALSTLARSRRLRRSIDTLALPRRRPLSLWLLKGPAKRTVVSTSSVRSLKNFETLYPTDKPYRPTTTQSSEFDRVEGLYGEQFVGIRSSRRRRKRRETMVLLPPMAFNDPAYPRQWHLYNRVTPGMDINVTGVWRHNITGTGVTVAVVDDGVEWHNPDLKANYNYKGSWDLNDGDPDPSPSYTKTSNHHGTRCAGEIAAVANNNVCGVGVAYGASVAGVRVLDGVMTDSMEAEAFNKNMDVNAIFSCSWGPDDDGATVDGPHLMAAKAMKFGVDFGRGGFGSIFVVASGNGGENGDNCNYDGYANSIYTVTIGAVDENGGMPYYAEECASMLGVTFSSGTLNKRDIVTTDWEPSVFGGESSSGGDGEAGGGILAFRDLGGGEASAGNGGVRSGGGVSSRSAIGGGVYRGATSSQGNSGGGCTERHTGTSAAAPLAAGVIALMLEARPCLTWRDVQYVVALTARKVDVEVAHWQNNGAGLAHSHKHGFGLLSAWRLVNAARVWKTVPWLTSYSFTDESSDWHIPKGHHDPLTIVHSVTTRDIQGLSLFIVEHVQLTVWLTHPYRGQIEVKVISPAGTVSTLAATRRKDNSSNGFNDWTFTTVRCWGETPTGDWTILVADHDDVQMFGAGRLNKYRLTLFGTPMTPEEFQERRKTVEAAMTGEFLHQNYNLHCPPPPKYQSVYAPVSERVLKILILSGIFLIVMAIYETFEYIFCYDDEKKEARETINAARRAARLAQEAVSVQDEEEFVQQTSALLARQSSEDTDHFNMNSNNSAHNFSGGNEISTSLATNTEGEDDDDDDDDFLTSSETSMLLSEDRRKLNGNKRNIQRGVNLVGKSVNAGGASTGASPSRDIIPLSTFSVREVERPRPQLQEEEEEELNTAEDHIGGSFRVLNNRVAPTSSLAGQQDRSTGLSRLFPGNLTTTPPSHNQNSLSSNGHVLSS